MKKTITHSTLLVCSVVAFYSAELCSEIMDQKTIDYINECSRPEASLERYIGAHTEEMVGLKKSLEIRSVATDQEYPLISDAQACVEEDDGEEVVINNYGVDMELAYSTTHRAAHHYILDVADNCLELEDQSIWQVRDKNKIKKWSRDHTIALSVNTNIFTSWFYPFKFVNLDTKEVVKAKLKLPGVLNDPNVDIHIHWIKNIDYTYGYVRLEDGSLWKLPSSDIYKLRSFATHQIVIVGTNDGWFRSSYPNLLISVKNGEHIRGIVVN